MTPPLRPSTFVETLVCQDERRILALTVAFLAGGTRRSRRRVLVTQIGADDDRLRRLREA